MIHMYQEDISGMNAIDHAFEKNSIFSIKLFIDSLLELDDPKKFRNCFDKALVLMIQKGIDVKKLINSQLMYPTVWTKKAYFSEKQDKQICAFNGTVEELE